jgi:chromosome segregation ATPase
MVHVCFCMKNRIGFVLVVLVAIGLGIGLVGVKRQAAKQQTDDAERINTLSNNWVKTSADLDEQRTVTAALEKDLETQKKSFGELSNHFTVVAANLSRTETSLQATEEEVKKRDAKILELEGQNQVLDSQAVELGSAITNLTVQIDDTRKKLAASEGDKTFLEGELKRLVAEKAELERQFNDLTVLRAQVSRLKEELSIARRIEWIRQGIFASAEQKGAQKLMQGGGAPQTQPRGPRSNYDLNVEVSADGSVKVVPPVTNSPAIPQAK